MSTAAQQRVSRPAAGKRRVARAPPEAVVDVDAATDVNADNPNAEGELLPGSSTHSPLHKHKAGPRAARTVSSSSPPRQVPRGKDAVFIQGPAFTKSAFFLLLALLLAAGLWKWTGRSGSRIGGDGETRLAIQLKEVEDMSKRATKWMQVQVEMLDMKMGKQAQQLRQELESKLEERAGSIEASMSSLQGRVGDSEASLHRLQVQGLITKSEAAELINTIISSTVSSESSRLSLDDVRAAARHIVEAELERHSADGIGMVDYALRSGGGKVVDHSEAVFHAGGSSSSSSWLDVLGAGLSAGGTVRHPMADRVIQPSFGEPGQCLPLKGSTDAFVDVALRTRIWPTAVTLEHVSKSCAYDVTSAPRGFTIWGWMEPSGSRSSSSSKVLLGEFTYALDGPSVQTFHLQQQQQVIINTVRLQIRSNHGNSAHTCIYRLRIHGDEAA